MSAAQRSIREQARRAKEASLVLASLDAQTKNSVLLQLAEAIDAAQGAILDANAADLRDAAAAGLSAPKLQRLALTPAALGQMVEGLRQIAKAPDPVGAVTLERTAPSGLRVRKVRAPLGVVAMIYEARPNVTIDAFALCFKAGNACILKGGKEARRSNEALAQLAREALRACSLPEAALTLITTSDRAALAELLTLTELIDLVIPRGGESLIRFVHERSRIATVLHFKGVCHVFVDDSAPVDRAVPLVVSAKTSAPATCNALECALVHENIAEAFVPALAEALAREDVELRGDVRVCELAPGAVAATEEDWGCEYLDRVLAVRVVHDMDEAIEHIHRHGSRHTEAILTQNEERARDFVARVHSSCVLVNASTRFNDGFQLGLGAEIGISTSKVHAFGPMGLEELTCQRWIAQGDWLTR